MVKKKLTTEWTQISDGNNEFWIAVQVSSGAAELLRSKGKPSATDGGIAVMLYNICPETEVWARATGSQSAVLAMS